MKAVEEQLNSLKTKVAELEAELILSKKRYKELNRRLDKDFGEIHDQFDQIKAALNRLGVSLDVEPTNPQPIPDK